MDYLKHFDRNPRVMGGETVIRGTRVPLRTVLASLADGDTAAVLIEAFPSLTEADVPAAIAFAASSTVELLPVPGVEPLPMS